MKRALFILILDATLAVVTLAASSAFSGDTVNSFIYEKHDCASGGYDSRAVSIQVDSYSRTTPKNIKKGILNTDDRLGRLFPMLKAVTRSRPIQEPLEKLAHEIGSTHSLFTVTKSDYCHAGEVCSISLKTTDGTHSRRMIQCGATNAIYLYDQVRSLIIGHRQLALERRRDEKQAAAASAPIDHDMAHGGALN